MNWQRWLMVVPALLFFVLFALVPLFIAVFYSGLQWNGIGQSEWVGLFNWQHVFANGEAFHAMGLTVELMALCWVSQTPISLLLGVFLAGKQRHRAVFGVFYFVPLLLSAVAIGITWSYLLNPNFGLVNALFKAMGIGNGNQDYIGNPSIALFVVCMIIGWQFIPFHTLLYQSGAKQIPETLYEAAKIDGASLINTFFLITLPQLKYTIITSSVLMLTGSLTYFDLIYVLTGGGPGNATEVLAMDMYKQAFLNQNIGAGSVLAVVLAASGVLLSILTLRFTGFNRMESQQEGM